MEVKILHLYYDIMNLYGEYGNIKILEQHLKDQGFEVTVDKKSIDEEKNLKEYDFVYIGCGTERNQETIMHDLMKDKDDLKSIIEESKVVLLTGNSYEILGKNINGKPALEVFEFETEYQKNRETPDVICTSEKLTNKVVGFINTQGIVKNNNMPLFKIEWNSERNVENEYEGIAYNNLMGTHLIGPLLIRNPEILKMIVEKICISKDKNFKYKDIEYEDEQKGYELVLHELVGRKETT